MAINIVMGEALEGNPFNNTILVDLPSVDALFGYTGSNFPYDFWTAWNRVVDGKGGDDLIVRDRVGDFTPSATLWHSGEADNVQMTGNTKISGGTGSDTVDYQTAMGGLEIDLAPAVLSQPVENEIWSLSAQAQTATGIAKAYGPQIHDIHGHDYLASIENVNGSNHSDIIRGDDGNNVIDGNNGHDLIEGRDGHDTLEGGGMNDTIDGGEGNDAMQGGSGHDDMDGGDGNDGMHGGSGNDTLLGGDGEDTLLGNGGNDQLEGGDGEDLIFGGSGYDVAEGGNDNDIIFLQGVGGEAYGGHGSDYLAGGSQGDILDAGYFMGGVDTLKGYGGDDTLRAGRNDIVEGGSGNDTVELDMGYSYGKGLYVEIDGNGDGHFGRLSGGGGQLDSGELDSVENVITGNKHDTIDAVGNLANYVETNNGHDTVHTWGGNDAIVLGNGNDFANAGSGHDVVDAGAGHDEVWGHSGNDTLIGFSGDDTLRGGSGNDIMDGGSGEDVLTGGYGADTLLGGTDDDVFVWNAGDFGLDTILDFEMGGDKLNIQSFLDMPVPQGGSYVGKVFAVANAEGDAVLAAFSNVGLQAFVELDGISAAAANAAIASGDLFQEPEPAFDGPGGLLEVPFGGFGGGAFDGVDLVF
jgi:Ca2+-binding RTX toxin-like protein